MDCRCGKILCLTGFVIAVFADALNSSCSYAEIGKLYSEAKAVYILQVTEGQPFEIQVTEAGRARTKRRHHPVLPPSLVSATGLIKDRWKGQPAESVRFGTCFPTSLIQAAVGDQLLVMLDAERDGVQCLLACGQGQFSVFEATGRTLVRVPDVDPICRNRKIEKHPYGREVCTLPLSELKQALLARES